MANEAVTTEKQLVVFNLADEDYGVDIGTVREIIQMQAITKVPEAPHFTEGVINLRGSVIPVVDLRKRFRLEEAERDKDSRIVVVTSGGEDIGIVVDSVAEVLRISSDSIEPASSIITTTNSEYLLGIVKLQNKMVILLDTDRVISCEERAALVTVASEQKAKDKTKKKAVKTDVAQEEAKSPVEEAELVKA